MPFNAPAITDHLVEIGKLNRLLADELARLPEVRTFKTRGARLALDDLQTIYQYAPDRFDRVFDRMNAEGLSGRRPFCSPLQALFWMIQDGKLAACGRVLGLDIGTEADKAGRARPCLLSGPDRNARQRGEKRAGYTLETVLAGAWTGESASAITAHIPSIIQHIRPEKEAREYALLVSRHSDIQVQGYILDDFMTKREIFDAGHWDMIQTALDQSRWKLFSAVADRLNSPDLISYYINKYFFFRKRPSSGVYFTFRNKKAQCTDAAYFTQFMLARAGYKTFMRSVKWDEDPWDGLHTGAGAVLENGTYLLVSNYTGINTVSGPFSDLDRLDEKMSCGRTIIHRRWGAYFPPRYF